MSVLVANLNNDSFMGIFIYRSKMRVNKKDHLGKGQSFE